MFAGARRRVCRRESPCLLVRVGALVGRAPRAQRRRGRRLGRHAAVAREDALHPQPGRLFDGQVRREAAVRAHDAVPRQVVAVHREHAADQAGGAQPGLRRRPPRSCAPARAGSPGPRRAPARPSRRPSRDRASRHRRRELSGVRGRIVVCPDPRFPTTRACPCSSGPRASRKPSRSGSRRRGGFSSTTPVRCGSSAAPARGRRRCSSPLRPGGSVPVPSRAGCCCSSAAAGPRASCGRG